MHQSKMEEANNFYRDAIKHSGNSVWKGEMFENEIVFPVAGSILNIMLVVAGLRRAVFVDDDVPSDGLDSFLEWLVQSEERKISYPFLSTFVGGYDSNRCYHFVINTRLIGLTKAILLSIYNKGVGRLLEFECPLSMIYMMFGMMAEQYCKIQRTVLKVEVESISNEKKCNIYVEICGETNYVAHNRFQTKAEKWDLFFRNLDGDLKLIWKIEKFDAPKNDSPPAN